MLYLIGKIRLQVKKNPLCDLLDNFPSGFLDTTRIIMNIKKYLQSGSRLKKSFMDEELALLAAEFHNQWKFYL